MNIFIIFTTIVVTFVTKTTKAYEIVLTQSPNRPNDYTTIYALDVTSGTGRTIAKDSTSRTAVSSATVCNGRFKEKRTSLSFSLSLSFRLRLGLLRDESDPHGRRIDWYDGRTRQYLNEQSSYSPIFFR